MYSVGGDMRTGSRLDVTIAILTWNGGAVLPRVLEAVFSQETGLAYEVLAVDSGSTDGTLEVLGRFRVRVVEVARGEFNFGLTRDLAYRESTGRFVINLSQDAVPARPDWLEKLVGPLVEDSEASASCGTSIPDAERDFAQFAWERNGYFYFTREMRKFAAKYGKGLSFSNSAVRRSVWERLRFDPQPTGEDFQLQKKLHGCGGRIVFPQDAPVLHHHAYSLGGLYRRCRNEGLALRILGCPYNELDLAADLAGLRKYVQLLREVRRGSVRTGAELAFPVLRPLAVYAGSRFGRRAVWR